ncbi:hypothetical protein chiPu_0022653, partial [Chiloscyllium punctatum]|nr:hypothetical protein [Chiloscyllium punctatum]
MGMVQSEDSVWCGLETELGAVWRTRPGAACRLGPVRFEDSGLRILVTTPSV